MIKHFNYTEEEMNHIMFSSLDNDGRCISCGSYAFNCEPDARKYVCEDCSEPSVYGVEELLMMGMIRIVSLEEKEACDYVE